MSTRGRRLTRLLWMIAACIMLLCLTAFSTAATSTDTEEEPITEYDIFVGTTRVTSENCKDILGDKTLNPEATPRAVFDHAKRQLTLQNVSLTQGVQSSGNIYSVACNEEKAITVSITGNCSFRWGIYVQTGDVTFDNASAAFDGQAGGAGYVQIDTGKLTIKNNSTISGTGIVGVTDVCFGADTILISGSVIAITGTGKSNSFGSVLYADVALEIENNSLVSYLTNGLSVNSFIESAEGTVNINNSNLQVRGTRYLIHLGDGHLTVDNNSKLYATGCLYGLSLGGGADIQNSTFLIYSYYAGIIHTAENSATFKARKSNFTIINLDFSEMQSTLLAPLWSEQTEALTEEYENYDAFVAVWRATYDSVAASAASAAFYSDNAGVSFSRCNVTVGGYLFGMLLRSNGHQLTFSDGTALSLAARGAAFMAITNAETEIRFGSRLNGDVSLFVLPAVTVLGTYGKYMVSISPADETLRMTGSTVTKPEDLLTAFTGYLASCNVSVDEFPFLAIAVPCIGIGVCAIAVIAVYLVRRKFKTDKPKESKEPPVQ